MTSSPYMELMVDQVLMLLGPVPASPQKIRDVLEVAQSLGLVAATVYQQALELMPDEWQLEPPPVEKVLPSEDELIEEELIPLEKLALPTKEQSPS